MANNPARYAVTFGLVGCYLPDSEPWAFEAATRRELADIVRSQIEFHEFPKASFGQVGIRRLWAFIKRNGSSVAHFSIQHGAYEIGFHGLTESEFSEHEAAQC